ncbi:LPS assembly lipoprotein LptE [Luminiphilus sp.]|nr:LPS assembly lipoprotein LptE [Luminiphilus sp.]|tara:strand:+ start:994 stop:1521 length:528 start_codon:yes stop_codon:yes gene_type:complete
MMSTLPNQPHRLAKLACLLAVFSCLMSCGFQLRGADPNGASTGLQGLELRLISVQPRSDLTREVSRELSNAGAVLTDVTDSALQLTLQAEQFSQRNVSLTAQARAAELELTLSVNFVLEQTEQDPTDARATVSRQMLNDPRNIVGKTEELRLLREEMRRDLAAQIVRRIGHSLSR